MTTWKVREVAAGEFKAKCLQLMEQVREEGIELVITKRGKPVAKLVPAEPRKDSPFGWMKGKGRILGDIVHTDPEDYEESPSDPLERDPL
ncbi:MAG TPA: type II toxin-antitoxin system prevent-host-death family antitoxin [Longimicrobiales bacterium]